jgi:hypothetical protein
VWISFSCCHMLQRCARTITNDRTGEYRQLYSQYNLISTVIHILFTRWIRAICFLISLVYISCMFLILHVLSYSSKVDMQNIEYVLGLWTLSSWYTTLRYITLGFNQMNTCMLLFCTVNSNWSLWLVVGVISDMLKLPFKSRLCPLLVT